ncbi:helix-turn-helix transcriptional regulator [Anaerovibrio sp.]|uniref:helix-turn-helix domain-containing protein n=1 Tax=Anaerovibrio sp. TaxID=1872532 RepID=UPI001B5388FF|nr:helix-turn-helix transcriptional regulator [Anaerovibrio sp.]MBP3232091.1 helix-turn-helix transcriptional regulator [Anaerovibrio sp.]MBR2143480.1 helix-turn-helix transcriptional regulator [Anaerovibrio sp.]
MFGERLRTLREHQEMSQLEVAKKLDIMQNTYSRYERGIREPDYATLKKIANFFGVSIDYLLGNDDPSLEDDLSDLENIFMNGRYTIYAHFPTDDEREMLRDLLRVLYRRK